jgi:hypothetical protein
VLTSNDKGSTAEAAIALEAISLGIEVLKPVAEHGRYDLALDMGERLLRVQCKWGAYQPDEGVIAVRVWELSAYAQRVHPHHLLCA